MVLVVTGRPEYKNATAHPVIPPLTFPIHIHIHLQYIQYISQVILPASRTIDSNIVPSAPPVTMMFSTTISRPLQLVTRALQWSSAVIVMGLTSFFISRGPRGRDIIYQEVIVRRPRLHVGHTNTQTNKTRPSCPSSSSFQLSSRHSAQPS